MTKAQISAGVKNAILSNLSDTFALAYDAWDDKKYFLSRFMKAEDYFAGYPDLFFEENGNIGYDWSDMTVSDKKEVSRAWCEIRDEKKAEVRSQENEVKQLNKVIARLKRIGENNSLSNRTKINRCYAIAEKFNENSDEFEISIDAKTSNALDLASGWFRASVFRNGSRVKSLKI